MKMNEVKSATWTKLAEIKTSAKTPMDVYKVLRKEFDADLYKDVLDVQICDDGIIIWGSSWKEV